MKFLTNFFAMKFLNLESLENILENLGVPQLVYYNSFPTNQFQFQFQGGACRHRGCSHGSRTLRFGPRSSLLVCLLCCYIGPHNE